MGTYAAAGFGILATALGISIREAKSAEAAEFRLAQILKTATGATAAQIEALNAQADALERVGVVTGEGVTQVQAQLATFDLQAETIAALTPAVLDYAVAEKGAAVTTEDLKQMTNGLAQALNGNFASLTRVGFVLDETTKDLVSNGTEAERVAAIVDVLNSTYQGFNEAARTTSEGGLVALNNEFGKLQETIGKQFIPVINQLVEAVTPMIEKVSVWVEQNPELTRNIILTALAVSGLIAMVGMLSVVMLAFNPVVAGVVLAIAGIGVVVYEILEILKILSNDWDMVWLGMKLTVIGVVNSVIGLVEGMINKVIEGLNAFIKKVNTVINKASEVSGLEISTIKTLNTVDLGRIDTEQMVQRSLDTQMPQQPVVITGNTFLSEDAAEQMGDLIMSRLKLSNAL